MNDLERKQTGNTAVYSKPVATSNPNVKRIQGAKTIVPTGSTQDNALNPTDASAPTNNRYTFLLKGDTNDA